MKNVAALALVIVFLATAAVFADSPPPLAPAESARTFTAPVEAEAGDAAVVPNNTAVAPVNPAPVSVMVVGRSLCPLTG